MRRGKLSKILIGLLIGVAVVAGLISVKHPIFLEWFTGKVSHYGKPIAAKVYVNGKENDRVKVFYTDEPNQYLISLAQYAASTVGFFITIDLNSKQALTDSNNFGGDHDFIGGHLFRRKTAEEVSASDDSTKTIVYVSELSRFEKEIRFTVPPGKFAFDSIRIVLR